MSKLATALWLFGFAFVVGVVVDWIRHWPRYRLPGVGTQHIAFIGTIIQGVLIGFAIGVLCSQFL